MTEEQIKESLSRSFLRLVANRAGFKCKFDEADHGVDITIAEVRARATTGGHVRLAETGRYLDIQLKTTCEEHITVTGNGFRYALEAKTYNDLVERWQEGRPATPLWLVVLILPDDATQWLAVGPAQLVLKRSAYWWRPPQGAGPTDHSRTITIEIPLANGINLDFVQERYTEFFG